MQCLTEAVLEGTGSAPAVRQCMSQILNLGTCLHKACLVSGTPVARQCMSCAHWDGAGLEPLSCG